MIKGVCISAKRTGSTFLWSCLNSHPQLTAFGELFVTNPKSPTKKYKNSVSLLPYRNTEYKSIVNYLEFMNSYFYNTTFKVMYNQIEKFELLKHLKNFPIIHLKRRNLVRWIISNENAHKTDFYVIQNLTAKNLWKRIQKSEKYFEKWDAILNDFNSITLYYEDILGKSKDKKTYLDTNTCKKICSFLNLEYFDMFSVTKKKNHFHVLEYLPEKEKTKDMLKDTKYEWMIS